MRRVLPGIVLLLALIVGCQSGLLPDAELGLPADIVNDVLRDSEFEFSVFAPVRLSLTVNSVGDAAAERRAFGPDMLVVQISDAQGRALYTASIQDGQILSGEVLVPFDSASVTLSVDSANHEPREVVIDDPAQYEEINRVMAIQSAPGSGEVTDRDGDGIDDEYDAFPDDPELAFTRAIPTTNDLRIAFEDNFPGLGDGDYNDFVAEYRIVEYRSAKNSLVYIVGVATAVARGAGYDHEFGIVIDFPDHTGTADVRYFDGDGEQVGTSSITASDSMRIVLFESTKDSFTREGTEVTMDNVDPALPASVGYTTTFTITYTASKVAVATDVWAPYNPYLLIDNPGLDYKPDVHLIGKELLWDSQNPEGELQDSRDADGYPRALLVPDDWMPPSERTHIEDAYPSFIPWRESLGMTNSDWYFYPDMDNVVPSVW